MSIQNLKQTATKAGLFIAVAVISAGPLVAIAQITQPSSCAGLVGLITRMSRFASAIIFILAVLVILIGAFYLLFGGASEDAAKKGRQYLVYGLLGVAVALVAFSLPQLVESITGLQTQGCP